MNAAPPSRSGAPARPSALLALLALLVCLGVASATGCATYSAGTPEARDLLNKGLKAYDEKEYDQAIEKMELALKQDPMYATCMAHLGIALHRRGFSDRGIKECEQSIKLNPELGEGYDNLGEIYFDQKRYDKAEEMYKEAIDLLPGVDDDHFSPHFNLGRLYQTQKKDAEALEQYLIATQNNPKHVAAHIAAGMLYVKNGLATEEKERDAEKHFKLALEYDSKNAVAHYGLGMIERAREQWIKAILCFRSALVMMPSNKLFQGALAETYSKSPKSVVKTLVEWSRDALAREKPEEALENLEAAGRIDPKNMEVRAVKTRAYLETKPKRVDEAIAAGKAGYALDAKSIEIRFWLGRAFLYGGKNKEAEELLRGLRREHPSIRKTPPTSLEIRKYLGQAFFKQRQYRRAEIEWREALKIDPEDKALKAGIEEIWKTPGIRKSNELNDKGTAALAQGSLDEARDYFRGAVELDDQFAVAHANLSLLAYQSGDWKEARRRAVMAIERDPDLGKAHLFLGMVEEKENKLEAAKRCYIEAAALAQDDAEPHFSLAMLSIQMKRMKEAEDAFEMALSINPNHCRSHYQLGLLFLGKGLIDKAEARMKLAIDACADYALPLVELARLFLRQKRYEEAIRFLERSAQLDNMAPEPWMGFAEAQKAQGEPLKACAAYLEAAVRFTGRRQFDEAVRACRAALAHAPITPKNDEEKALQAQCHNDLGVALMNTGGFTESIAELKKADDLEPNNLWHRLNMGLCYTKMGDKKRAADAYRDILAASPNNHIAMELLADLYTPGAKENVVTKKEALDLLRRALPLEKDEERKGAARRKIEELEKER